MSESRWEAATEAVYDYEVRIIGFTGDEPTKHHRAIAAAILAVADKWKGARMSERDELAELIRKGSYTWPYPLLISESEAIADEILAAGFRKVEGSTNE